MDGCCDICGGLTEKELIATCAKCNINCEHPYCMRRNLLKVPDDWICEPCELGNIKITSPKSGLVHHNGSGWQDHSRRQKAVETGKVKFIPNDEAIKLSSGFPTMRYQRSIFSSKSGHSSFVAPKPQKTPFESKSMTPKSPMSTVKENPSIIPVRTVKPTRCDRHIRMQSISKINQRTSPILMDSKELKAPLAQNSKEYGSSDHLVAVTSPAKEARSSKLGIDNETKTSVASGKEHVWEKQPMKVLLPVKDVETSYKKMETAMVGDPCTVSAIRHLSPISNLDEEERDLLNIFASFNLNHSCLPAVDVSWRGGFVLEEEFIGGFQAQRPCKVHPKVSTFSKKMPLVLRADWLPRSNLWSDLFQHECPDLQDIALYFFPDENIERSTENLDRLIERMEERDSMMRIGFDNEGVELLIFASETLQLDSRMASFLWGVFRPIKKDLFRCNKGHDQENMDDNMAMDMEIDMLGGKTVGRVDMVVSRDAKVAKKTRTSPEMKTGTRYGIVKCEISSESEKELVGAPPGFHARSPQTATSLTEGMALARASSTVQHRRR